IITKTLTAIKSEGNGPLELEIIEDVLTSKMMIVLGDLYSHISDKNLGRQLFNEALGSLMQRIHGDEHRQLRIQSIYESWSTYANHSMKIGDEHYTSIEKFFDAANFKP